MTAVTTSDRSAELLSRRPVALPEERFVIEESYAFRAMYGGDIMWLTRKYILPTWFAAVDGIILVNISIAISF